jgi:soluble cytochrome b562
MVEAHDDKISKVNDDRKIFEARCNQLRKDIREFEKLCVDISHETRSKVDELKGNYQNDMDKLLSEIDDITN